MCVKGMRCFHCFTLLWSSLIQLLQCCPSCVTDLNCVSNIPLKVITQLGRRGFQQIMVAGGRTTCVDVSGWVYVGVTCLIKVTSASERDYNSIQHCKCKEKLTFYKQPKQESREKITNTNNCYAQPCSLSLCSNLTDVSYWGHKSSMSFCLSDQLLFCKIWSFRQITF